MISGIHADHPQSQKYAHHKPKSDVTNGQETDEAKFVHELKEIDAIDITPKIQSLHFPEPLDKSFRLWPLQRP